jgi:hypothetical protein
MKKFIAILICITFFIPLYVVSQEKPKEETKQVSELTCEIKLGTGIKDKEIEGEATSFSANVDKVWCWTLIKGAKKETYVTHEWYYGDKKMAEVKLDVKYPSHRTWSRKTILKEWTGNWKVKVIDEKGNVLGVKEFKIEK